MPTSPSGAQTPTRTPPPPAELDGIGTGKFVALQCDVGDEEQVDAAFAATVEALGKVDSCFANAGIGGGAKFTDMTLDTWRRVQRVNSEGAFLTLRAAARHKVTANAIIPGWIATDMTAAQFAWQKFADNVMPRIPHRRWGEPDDFSGIAVYCRLTGFPVPHGRCRRHRRGYTVYSPRSTDRGGLSGADRA